MHDCEATGAVTPSALHAAGHITVAIVHSRARVTLPQLVIRPRRRLADGVLPTILVVCLAAGMGFFHQQWQESESDRARQLEAWQAERDNRTGLYVHLDQGVECKSPQHSQLWLDVVRETCRALGDAYRHLVLSPGKKR